MPICYNQNCRRQDLPNAVMYPPAAKVPCAHAQPDGIPCPDLPGTYDADIVDAMLDNAAAWDKELAPATSTSDDDEDGDFPYEDEYQQEQEREAAAPPVKVAPKRVVTTTKVKNLGSVMMTESVDPPELVSAPKPTPAPPAKPVRTTRAAKKAPRAPKESEDDVDSWEP